MICNKPDNTHSWPTTIRSRHRTFHDVVPPECREENLAHFINAGMIQQGGDEHLPRLEFESETLEERSLVLPIAMRGRKEVMSDLPGRHNGSLRIGEFH